MKNLLLLFVICLGSLSAQISPPPTPSSGGTCSALAGDTSGTCGANTVDKIKNGAIPTSQALIATNSSGQLIAISTPIVLTKTATANNTTMGFGLESETNTCNPTTDYQFSQGGAGVNFAAIGMAGCVGVAVGSTNQGAAGVQGSTVNASLTTNAIGGYFPALVSGDGSGSATAQRVRIWALNSLVNDGTHNHTLMTNELDFNVDGADTKLLGLQLTGLATQDMSTDSAGVLVGPLGTHKWPTAFYCTDGASTVCYIAGATSTSNNVSSTPIRMISRTSGGVNNTADITAGPGGGMSFTLSAGAGYSFINAVSTTELTILGGGGVNWPGTALAALGTPANGTIIYCSDCANASNPCTASSSGAIAKRLNGAWDCR